MIYMYMLSLPCINSIKGLKESRSEPVCPVINLCPSSPSESRQDDMNRLEAVVAECRASGVAIVTAKYLEKEELFLPPPGYVSKHTQAYTSYVLYLLFNLLTTCIAESD